MGDHLRLTIYRGHPDRIVHRIDTFGVEVTFKEPHTLSAPRSSLFRKALATVVIRLGYADFLVSRKSGISSADPAVWGRSTFLEPLNTDYDPSVDGGGDTHVLMMPTAGDSNVPVNTGITMGRASGLLGSGCAILKRLSMVGVEISTPDERYGNPLINT